MSRCLTVTDAAYHSVHDYPGGATALALRIGVSSAGVLSNKVNPLQDHHKLTLDEAVLVMAFSGDLRILHAIADRFDQLVVPVVRYDQVSDTALLETYTRLMKELGEFSSAFHDALSDGKFTRAELDGMRGELRDFERAGEELLNRAEQLVDDE